MNIASHLEHTILKPDTTQIAVERVCEEAITYQFAAVCVPPFYVKDAHKLLDNAAPVVATVIGFPMGYTSINIKSEEIKRACDEGADHLDTVINIAAVKNGDWVYLQNEVSTLTRVAHLKDKQIKFILETGLLTSIEIEKLCVILANAEVDFAKTSTGNIPQGASLEIIKTLRKLLPSTVKIKASGGIKTFDEAMALLQAGADRIGTSAAVSIFQASQF
ncbi:MAG: deoxyribose-phosphate aldolase [Saprospiraceae bacterium]|nr:deoxyribose-phosphate aldolase [Saprospiraceae bacterium]MBP7679910.1 deoxyribose-phosphate aldolase [Saprospiraceae bacterium]